ncbi:hypothetical protein FEM08_08070 [Flavobacterium gilvum]|nr:hypothetical protein FEM08_08070 [Flavobacterium gilvum]
MLKNNYTQRVTIVVNYKIGQKIAICKKWLFLTNFCIFV